MPDQNGKLTPDEQDEVSEWLTKKSPYRLECPLCGNDHLGVGNQLVAPVPINGRGKAVNATTYPLVTLTCSRCQHVSFVNVTGVLKQMPRSTSVAGIK